MVKINHLHSPEGKDRESIEQTSTFLFFLLRFVTHLLSQSLKEQMIVVGLLLMILGVVDGFSRVFYARRASWNPRVVDVASERVMGKMSHDYQAFSRLCAVDKIKEDPFDDEEEDEDLSHLTTEFNLLAAGSSGVSFSSFLRSEEVQAIIADDSTFLQDIAGDFPPPPPRHSTQP